MAQLGADLSIKWNSVVLDGVLSLSDIGDSQELIDVTPIGKTTGDSRTRVFVTGFKESTDVTLESITEIASATIGSAGSLEVGTITIEDCIITGKSISADPTDLVRYKYTIRINAEKKV